MVSYVSYVSSPRPGTRLPPSALQYVHGGSASSSTLHTLLQRAAQIHQEGDLDKAVQVLKQLLRQEPNHPEAYMALAKALNDQGKYDLAAKASAKATRIQNDRLAEWSLV